MSENLRGDQQGAEFHADTTGRLFRTVDTPPIAPVPAERTTIPDLSSVLEAARPAEAPAEVPAAQAGAEMSTDVMAGLDQAEAFANDPANASEAGPAEPDTPEAAEKKTKKKKSRVRRALKVAGTLALIDMVLL